jgi:hypothetical protein
MRLDSKNYVEVTDSIEKIKVNQPKKQIVEPVIEEEEDFEPIQEVIKPNLTMVATAITNDQHTISANQYI